jgi:hypothetical protein
MRAEDIEGSNLLDLLDLLDMLLPFAYWSLDVILSFFMPYERDVVHISDCRMTSLHYVQRSFILDLLAVLTGRSSGCPITAPRGESGRATGGFGSHSPSGTARKGRGGAAPKGMALSGWGEESP